MHMYWDTGTDNSESLIAAFTRTILKGHKSHWFTSGKEAKWLSKRKTTGLLIYKLCKMKLFILQAQWTIVTFIPSCLKLRQSFG